MTSESEMVRTGIAARVQAGHSPPLRKRRTREYIPNSRTKLQQHMGNNDQGLQDENHELANELTFRTRENGYHHSPDENMNTISRSDTTRSQYQDILKFVPENSHLSERYQILRAENKILRERLQNALQREMKALKTFKRLAKENRQLKMNLRKYERTLLGFYDDESDSDLKEQTKDKDANVTMQSTNEENLCDGVCERLEAECNQTGFLPPEKITKTVSTSTEDIARKITEDKSTSTDDLEILDAKSGSMHSSVNLSDAGTDDVRLGDILQDTNLTGATKAKFLQNQLLSSQSQGGVEIRKFSAPTRYWAEPMLVDNFVVSTLQRASSSPSLLGASGENASSIDACIRKSLSFQKLRGPETNNLLSVDCITRSRPSSFHEIELSPVPEVAVPPQEESVDTEESSRSTSPSSSRGSHEDLGSLSTSPIHSNIDGQGSQKSACSSPLQLNSVMGTKRDELSPSPQLSPSTSPQIRRKIAHTVSLPMGALEHYLSLHGQNLPEQSEPCERRRKSADSDETDVESNRQTSVSLKFEGDIEKENAESLAADIAEFLNSRKNRLRSATVTEPSPPPVKENPTDDVLSQEEHEARMMQTRSLGARRGSAVVSLPGDHYKMDLHVLDKEQMEGKFLGVIREKKELYASTMSLNSIDPEKRSRWSILRRNKKMLTALKDKPRQGEDFKDCLARMRENPKAVAEHELAEFKDSHWTEFMSPGPNSHSGNGFSALSDHETKRREAVWELFHSEVVYLMSHLLVLKEVFLEPLKEIQQMGNLQHVNVDKIFCNVHELCEVSAMFAKNLFRVFQTEKPTQFGSTAAVVSAFTEFSRKVHPQYQKYCLNYSKALSYLDSLKKEEDFQEFMKWCESDTRCNRLQITDLLVAPLQHLTKYPLLLKNIRKRTAEGDEQHSSLSSIIKAVELSIKELEGKVKSVANYERLQELQSSLVWPSITELDPKAFIPEFLRGILAKQPCESLLASPKRQLLYEGSLMLHENAKVDVYAFLFDDMLLLTRFRKLPQKVNKKLNLAGMTIAESPPSTPPVIRRSMSGIQYTVYKQPIPLDRFIIIDTEATPAGGTLKNSFIIIHYSRFKQTVGLYTLQAPSQNLKETWTSTLKAAQSRWSEAVALELAAETEKMKAFQNISDGETEQDTAPKSPDEVMNQTQMLSYYKPIESKC
ncbi:pleckstrin homology domain-containing family G member 5-like isoform X1 [Acropora millepora]|uniref:pleckstrin homology domain-containing family G member 5-like isoform X1 n=1 Tax=Acropora millepora TaxID=45264 RepID=UPI001CF1B649|nr:pleckstrin homology domain-containing family G member 5-like isoform X1 [Acropora millepora]XP_029212226.2 pleckstrin homology domain-containing family G member 5-like isoform X1 [Acropora millepora]XP_029212227.2 pleckstrin homology domain-containing family G member 5-like isoform X1 [Acropora millepora]XP_029212229.2 pleckstrin homology domain-containing family G member 5-like isoform X1 [Acropora millepora]XP_029212230.2 pleckstrin homology domain-containing family G member 5-like isoform